jgi:predicted RNase H-like nuclease (RuvC/YqgF family)
MNNETQHTAGPWFLVKETMKPFAEGSVRFYIDDQNGFRIYDPVSEGLKGRTRQEAEANAKLIASAPSLLKENQELKAENERISKIAHEVNRMYSEVEDIKSINEELIKALEWFCERVDKGEVRSVRTYARFKTLLFKSKTEKP